MCFSSYKNCKLIVKLWWVGAGERKKSSFFMTFSLSKGNSISMYCVLNKLSVYTLTYQKTLLHTLLLLVLKIVVSLSVSLSSISFVLISFLAWGKQLETFHRRSCPQKAYFIYWGKNKIKNKWTYCVWTKKYYLRDRDEISCNKFYLINLI